MTTKRNVHTQRTLLMLLFALLGLSANAQIKYGFKTGLNFARITGPSEISDAGLELENWKNTTGFHIGVTFSHKFSDKLGVRGEFLYSKRGAKYTFDGPSYRVFRYKDGTQDASTLTFGNSRYLINISNSYLDVPVMAFGRFGDFEISAGGYVGVLIQSSGEGSLRYSGKTANLNNDVFDIANNNKDLSFNINYNYRKDNVGEGSVENEQPVSVKVDAFTSSVPKTLGAYYDYPEDKGSLYKAIDYGVVGGVSYYISHALYLSVRLQYGLADITNNAADLSKAHIGATSSDLIFREDKDKNFVVQASVGFSF